MELQYLTQQLNNILFFNAISGVIVGIFSVATWFWPGVRSSFIASPDSSYVNFWVRNLRFSTSLDEFLDAFLTPGLLAGSFAASIEICLWILIILPAYSFSKVDKKIIKNDNLLNHQIEKQKEIPIKLCPRCFVGYLLYS